MKFTSLSCISLVLAIAFVTSSHGEPSSYLPISHRAYDFLERMEGKFLLHGAYLGTKPATRVEIASFLFGLMNEKRFMTNVEKAEL